MINPTNAESGRFIEGDKLSKTTKSESLEDKIIKKVNKFFSELSPEDVKKLELNIARKSILGKEVMDKLEFLFRNELIGVDSAMRPHHEIDLMHKKANLLAKTRKDLETIDPFSKHDEKTLNKVFIQQEAGFVIKAPGEDVASVELTNREVFAQDLAGILNLDQVILPMLAVELKPEQLSKLEGIGVSLTEKLRVNLSQYVEWKADFRDLSKEEGNINLQSYQMAAIFSGVTQQTDHHPGNIGVINDKDGKRAFLLYDNDLCMQPGNVLAKVINTANGKTQYCIPIRSSFLGLAEKDTPLTMEMREIIEKWDAEKIIRFCQKQYQPATENSPQTGVYLSEQQINAFKERLENVKKMISDNPQATVYDCFKAMYPLLQAYQESYFTSPEQTSIDYATGMCNLIGGSFNSFDGAIQEAYGNKIIDKRRFVELRREITRLEDAGKVFECVVS